MSKSAFIGLGPWLARWRPMSRESVLRSPHMTSFRRRMGAADAVFGPASSGRV